jgi:hypothetical protein
MTSSVNRDRSRSRRGSASAMSLVAISMAATTALALGHGFAAARLTRGELMQRIQAREFALGAQTLAPGTYAVGAWTITVAKDHAVDAGGRAGTCHIAADGAETWTPAGNTAVDVKGTP